MEKSILMVMPKPERNETTLTSKELAKQIIEACKDAKGQEISVLDVSTVFGLSDYFIIVSGRSDRQSRGISNRILNDLKDAGVSPGAVEGYDDGQWILMDYGDVIVHVFYGPTREYYDLESLWLKAERISLPITEQDGQEAA